MSFHVEALKIGARASIVAVLALACAANSRAQSATESSAAIAAPALDQADLEAWLDGFLPGALQRGDIAGAVVLVVKDGQILVEKGYGYADVAARKPMDPERTVVSVGSVSKLFTWTAAMQQVEEGKLDLDRDINEYLDFRIPEAFGKPITLRHLLTHTAGFEERAFRQVAKGSRPRSLHDYIRGTPVPERIYAPGAVVAYSNYGAMLAGYLVEQVSGEPFVGYVQRHILDPLNMRHSTFQRPAPARLAAELSRSYDVASGEPDPLEDEEEPSGDPSGHLITTASDISHFMLAHLSEGEYAGHHLLEPETARSMHTPAVVPMPGAHGVGLGFFQMDYNGRRIAAHMGDILSFHSDVELLPDERVGFFMAVNSNGTSSGVLFAANTLRSALFRGFMDRYFPMPDRSEPTLATAKEHARLMAGEYRMSRRSSGDFMEAVELIVGFFAIPMTITAHDDGTIETPAWLNFANSRPQRWREVAPFRWREAGGRDYLSTRVEDGRVTAFFTSGVLPAWVNERLPRSRSPSWNVPPFLLACAALVVAMLSWPITAVVRRRYRGKHELAEPLARSVRLTRWAAAVGVLFLLGWIIVLGLGLHTKVGAESWIRLVQLIGLACIAGAGVAVWNAWLTVTRGRGAWSRICSVVLALAMLELVWFSLSFHLLSVHLVY